MLPSSCFARGEGDLYISGTPFFMLHMYVFPGAPTTQLIRTECTKRARSGFYQQLFSKCRKAKEKITSWDREKILHESLTASFPRLFFLFLEKKPM